MRIGAETAAAAAAVCASDSLKQNEKMKPRMRNSHTHKSECPKAGRFEISRKFQVVIVCARACMCEFCVCVVCLFAQRRTHPVLAVRAQHACRIRMDCLPCYICLCVCVCEYVLPVGFAHSTK